MALPTTTDALLVLVLLIPGFVTLSAFRWLAIFEKELSEYKLVLWSLFFSLVIYGIFGWYAGISDIEGIKTSILIPGNLLSIFALSLTFGVVPGLFVRWTIRKDFFGGNCWDAAMKEASKKGSWVSVYTNDCHEYLGYLHYNGEGDEPRDISIREPERIFRDADENVTKKLEMGKEVYFLEKDIKRIIFHSEV